MINVVIFAASECAKEREEYYLSLAYETGKVLAQRGCCVITGGGPGLMHAANKGAFEAGGTSVGICLEEESRKPSQYLTTHEKYDKLTTRQERLISFGDAFIALPGGIGTFSEIYEVLARKRKKEFKEHTPIILLGKKYYESMEAMHRIMKTEGFVRDVIDTLYTLVDTPSEAVDIILSDLKKI
jgi:uncharacterized protein (TIGR00730 family)